MTDDTDVRPFTIAIPEADAQPGRRSTDLRGLDQTGRRPRSDLSHLDLAQGAQALGRSPRITLDLRIQNPYHSVEIRGTAEMAEDHDRTLSKELSRKYLGQDPPDKPASDIRLIVRVTPTDSGILA